MAILTTCVVVFTLRARMCPGLPVVLAYAVYDLCTRQENTPADEETIVETG